MTALLEVSDLVKHFTVGRGIVRAVEGVSFSIERGETLGLVGESGCGKSTAGRCVLQLYTPTAGEVRFRGQELGALGPNELQHLRTQMQIIFQDPYSSLNPRMTAGQIVSEPLTVHKLAGSRAALHERIDELFTIAMGILGLGERQRVRLFLRRDQLDRFVDCLVCIPRDRFNTENRERVGRILMEEFAGSHLDWTVQLTESLLARVHYIIHCPDKVPAKYDVDEVEARLVQATRAWTDDLRDALIDEFGEQRGRRMYKRYERAFPPGYRSDWLARSAVADISADD